LSVTIKEYKEVPLSLLEVALTPYKPRLIPSARCFVATIEAGYTTMHDVNIESALAD